MASQQFTPTPLITQWRQSFSYATDSEMQTAMNAWFAALAPLPDTHVFLRGVTSSSAQVGASSGGGSGTTLAQDLLSLLRATTGEESLHSKLGRWRLAVSDAFAAVGGGAVLGTTMWNVTLSGSVDSGIPGPGEVVLVNTARSAFRFTPTEAGIPAALSACAADLVAHMTTPDAFDVLVTGSATGGWLVGILAMEE